MTDQLLSPMSAAVAQPTGRANDMKLAHSNNFACSFASLTAFGDPLPQAFRLRRSFIRSDATRNYNIK